MDFELSDEQRMILDYGSKLAESFDRKQWLDYARRHEFPEHIWRQMGEDGFLGLMVPEEYGGAGLGMMEMSLLMEGMADHGIPMQHLVVGPTMCLAHLARHGTEEQKQRYLPPACAGKEVWCFAITEPTRPY